MQIKKDPISDFLHNYHQDIQVAAEKLRVLISQNLPDIIEQVDKKTKMIAWM